MTPRSRHHPWSRSRPSFSEGQRADPSDVTLARGKTRYINFTTNVGTWTSVDLSPDGSWIAFDLLGHVRPEDPPSDPLLSRDLVDHRGQVTREVGRERSLSEFVGNRERKDIPHRAILRRAGNGGRDPC